MSTPEIDTWYGDRQSFGRLGNPQRWINILGSVRRAQSLSYSLNGSPDVPLATGPDGLRLRAPGDFNADIAIADLVDGTNTVAFGAVGGNGDGAERQVEIDYTAGRTWPLPYSVDCTDIASISDAVQIVDGRWRLTPQGIRPVHPHYDRLVAVGDRSWTDYRLTVSVTVRGFVPGRRGLTGGFGLLLRWTGHYPDEHQPHREWRPSGAIGWYRARWEESPATVRCLNISDGVVKDVALVEAAPCELDPGMHYVFEFSVRSRPGRTSLYRYRAWPQDRPDALLCDLETEGRRGESPRGSALIIALYCDVTIGNLSVEPL